MSINAQPFSPTFKLVGNLQQDQVLVFDVSENAFVNTVMTASGDGSSTAAVTEAASVGTGESVFKGLAGSCLEFKSLIGGSNITITDNIDNLVIDADFTESIQSGTNLGTGTALYSGVDVSNALQFKSLAVSGDLTITDNNGTITIGTNVSANGWIDAHNNLSDLNDVAVARTNIDVFSKDEVDTRFLRSDTHSLPSVDNQFDIGSPTRRFNDIYAETFQGIAVLANNLTLSGTNGQVLTYRNGTWAAEDSTGGETVDLTGYATQTFVQTEIAEAMLDGTVDLSTYVTDIELTNAINGIVHPTPDLTPYALKTEIPSVPADVSELTDTTGLLVHTTVDLTPYALKTEIPSVPTDVSQLTDTTNLLDHVNLTGYATETWVNNAINNIAHPTTDLTGYATETYVQTAISGLSSGEHFSGNYADLTGTPTIPSDVSDLTDTTGLLTHVDLTNYALKSELFSGEYADLGNVPSIPSDVSQLTDTTNLLVHPTVDLTPYALKTEIPTIPTIPSDVSDLTDTTGLLDHVSLTGYATETYVNTAISNASIGGSTYTDSEARAAISSGTGLAYNSTTGVMALNASLGNLLDVNTTGITNGQVLKWNGVEFVAGDDTVLTSTDQLPEGSTNKWYTDARVENVLNTKTTSDISEGTNLYYTDARVDARLGTQLVAGNNVTLTSGVGGTITISSTDTDTVYTDADARGAISVSGDLAYNATTGVISYTTPTIPTDINQLNDIDNLLADTTVAGLTANSTSQILSLDSGWHLLPTDNVQQDLGSQTKQWRDLYLSGNTIHMGGSQLTKDSVTGKPKWDGADMFDYTNLSNTPMLDDLPRNEAATNKVVKQNDLSGIAFTGEYADLANVPVIPTDVANLTDTTNLLGSGSVDLTGYATEAYVGNAIANVSTFSGNYNDLTNKPTLFDGAYSSLTGKPTIPADVSDLTDTTNLLTTQTDLTGYATETFVNNAIANVSTFDGNYNSLTNKPVLFDGNYNSLTNRPDVITQGTGIQVNSGVVSLNANLAHLQDVSGTAPTNGQVLKWDGLQWAPSADNEGSGGGASTINELTDVDTTGIASGQFLSWNGTKFVATAAPSGGGAATIDELTDVDTTSSAPTNGQALTWNGTNWVPATISTSSGGSSTVFEFEVGYNGSNVVTGATNLPAGWSASVSGSEITITHNVGDIPMSITYYGLDKSTDPDIWKMNKPSSTYPMNIPDNNGAPSTTQFTLNAHSAATGANAGTPFDTSKAVIKVQF